MPDIKAILWDMDGVLVNSEQLWKDEYPRLLKSFGITFESERFAKIAGSNTAKIYEFLCDWYPDSDLLKISQEDFVKAEVEHGLKAIYPRTVLSKGVREILMSFQDQGIPQALISSSAPEWIAFALDKHDLKGFFQFTLSGLEQGIAKPDPAIYQLALDRLHISGEDALVIEDSKNGTLAGKGAGCVVYGYRNSYNDEQDLSEADFIFDDFRKLEI